MNFDWNLVERCLLKITALGKPAVPGLPPPYNLGVLSDLTINLVEMFLIA